MVVVDADIDVTDHREVCFQVAANVDGCRDVIFHEGSLDPCDHASENNALVRCVALDATAKFAGETVRPWPARTTMLESIRELVAGLGGIRPRPGPAPLARRPVRIFLARVIKVAWPECVSMPLR